MKVVNRLRDPTWRRYGSYAFDWILCIVLIAVFLYLDSVDPFHREFSVQNPAIMYSYRLKDSVPTWALIVISVGGPVVLILLIGLGIRRSPYDVHNGVLGLLVSVLLTTMFTQVIKVFLRTSYDLLILCCLSSRLVPIATPFEGRLCTSSQTWSHHRICRLA